LTRQDPSPKSARRTKLGERYPNIYFREIIERGRTKPTRIYEVGFRDSTGAQRWKITGPKLDDALDFRDSVLGRRRQGERVVPASGPFSEAADAWLAAQSNLRPRTRATYGAILRVHLKPRLGRRKVATITEEDVARLIADLRQGSGPDGERRQPLKAWTIKGVLVVLSRVMSYAARRGMIAANPVAKLERGERPRVEEKEKRILNGEEITKLIAAARPGYRAVIAAAVFTGCRQGELLGLRWADVDFDAGLVHVRGQLDRSKQRVEGKTAASRREVVLMPALARILREHKASSRFSKETDYVFATATGSPPSYRNIVRRGFEQAAEKAGLSGEGRPKLRWHDLRHIYASMLIGEGLDVVYVSRQLGHVDPAITLKVYAKLFDRQRHADTARDAMEARYGSVLEAVTLSDEFPPVPDEGGKLVSMRPRALAGTGGNASR
jgi:integrase